MVHFEPTAGKSLEDREREVRHAEQEVAALESRQSAAIMRMEKAARELDVRIQQVKAAASLIQLAGLHDPTFAELYQRLNVVSLPSASLEEPREHALIARVKSVNTRAQAMERNRGVVQKCLDELARLAEQLAADEAAIQSYQGRLEEEAAARGDSPQEISSFRSGSLPRPRPSAGQLEARAMRVRMQAVVAFTFGSNTYRGFSTNVAEGGLFISTVEPPLEGTVIGLDFTIPGGRRIKTEGIVLWIRRVNDLSPDTLPGMGLRFHGLNSTDLAAIRELVAQREPLFFSE